MNLLGRKETPAPETPDEPPVEKTGGKNAPTPRRNQARATRAKTLKAAPLSNKEKRAKTRAAMDATRASLKETDLSKLPANERVPELVYARDLVDSRINLGTAVIPVAVIYFFGSFAASAVPVVGQSLLFLALFWFLAMIADAVIMSRKLEAKVQARFPGSTVKVRMYAGRRAFALKRMRRPVPREVPPTNRWKYSA